MTILNCVTLFGNYLKVKYSGGAKMQTIHLITSEELAELQESLDKVQEGIQAAQYHEDNYIVDQAWHGFKRITEILGLEVKDETD
jgi:hypothetical protein